MKPPKPFLIPKRKSKRLPRRKPVTLCAAGISRRDLGSSIFVVSDTKLSFWNGAFSGDRMATKVTSINDSWLAMIGGDVSAMVPFLSAIEDVAQKDKKNTLRNFARLCSRAYRDERKKIIETEILSQYDIGSYEEYRNLKHSEANLFDAITKEIKAADETWFLLFCGFDDERQPHIFIISENGKIQFCDTEGFAAIGLGASAFIVSMTAYPF